MRLIGWVARCCVAWVLAAYASGRAEGEDAFHMAFTRSTFAGINENDARATLKALGQTVAREFGVPVQPQVSMFQGAQDLSEALAEKRVDAVALLVTEFQPVQQHLRQTSILTAQLSSQDRDRYLLLVRQDRAIHGLEELRDKRLGIYDGLRACLAEPWLEVSLNEARLPSAPKFFSLIERESKLARVVLPVFFGKSDACLVTQSGFDAMRELNPKLGTQLTAILRSDPVATMILAFRAGYEPPYFERLEKALVSLHESPVGRQMLTIFQIDRLEARPLSVVEPSLELLRRHQAIRTTPATGEGGGVDPGRRVTP